MVDKKDLDKYIAKHRSTKEKSELFVDYLYFLMDKYGIKDASSVYNTANISRQLWSSIISNKSNPSLNVCLKIAFTLKVNNHECKYLLKKAGYTLGSQSTYSLIIRYAFEHKIYNINTVNEMLTMFGYIDSLIQ